MEQLYQYIWKHKLWSQHHSQSAESELLTVDGHKITVLYPGRHNSDAGPDFLGARIKIDDREWAGNVEIHVRASDWKRHGHSADPAYGNVILHVVGVDDLRIPDSKGGYIPQTVITFPEAFVSLYARMAKRMSKPDCADAISGVGEPALTFWLDKLVVERMQRKSQRIIETVRHLDGDWQRACFVTLARALGFSLNADPMEMLARNLPLSVVAKHSDSLLQIEALLFGQAGMLDTSIHIFDEYYQTLCREYYFLARKYGLKPMRADLWKFARTRPQNFPTRRIALLAKALEGGFSLMADILEKTCNKNEAETLFDWELGEYWLENLDFDQPCERLSPSLSFSAKNLLRINLAAPLLYAYGAWRGDEEMSERGLDLWHESDSENNAVIRQWNIYGLKPKSAADSQALIELSNEYCEHHRCRDCRFGYAMLQNAMKL